MELSNEELEEKKIERFKNAPKMQFGKYKGTKVSDLPNSYLKWMLGQKFPEELLAIAREKLSTNKTVSHDLEVTRHAVDKFSLLYLGLWKQAPYREYGLGLASYIAHVAMQAFHEGTDVSRKRHKDENVTKELNGIKYVFNRDGELKVLITVF